MTVPPGFWDRDGRRDAVLDIVRTSRSVDEALRRATAAIGVDVNGEVIRGVLRRCEPRTTMLESLGADLRGVARPAIPPPAMSGQKWPGGPAGQLAAIPQDGEPPPTSRAPAPDTERPAAVRNVNGIDREPTERNAGRVELAPDRHYVEPHRIEPEHDVAPSLTGVRTRLVFPDHHGFSVDPRAEAALLADIAAIDPDEIVGLGDLCDVSGIFSAHKPTYVEELAYSFEQDLGGADRFLSELQRLAPRARMWLIEGNHDQHVERWIARNHTNARDAEAMRRIVAVESRLRFADRGIRYARTTNHYHGLTVPGTIKLGKCHFAHGHRTNVHATASHLHDFNENIVHGHTHQAREVRTRNIGAHEIGAWCPGTLSLLQPMWRHNTPSKWTHGYHVQIVEPDGSFWPFNVQIRNGKSGLAAMLNAWNPSREKRCA